MHDGSTRRSFLWTAALAGAGVGLSGLGGPLTRRLWAGTDGAEGLKVLVLGGTGQTGPHLIRELLGRGHTVTMFNRGNRSEDLFPNVECLVGDRDPEATDGLTSLLTELDAGRSWDVCIDIWPHIPKIVERTATLLHDHVGHFMYVSSISAYADNSKPGANETSAVGEAPDADETEYTDALFGPFKAECENRVRRIYPDNHTIFRPGLIVGPRDFSFRGVYWPVRIRRGGEVLAPGDGTDAVQLIDGRDLTAFEARCMEHRIGGTFNVVGNPMFMRELLDTCRAATGSDADLVWVPAAFLAEHGVAPWAHMTCWVPAEGEYAGFGSYCSAAAQSFGLRFRPLAETVRDTLAWYDKLPDERREQVSKRSGLPADKEAEVLAAWHAAQKQEKAAATTS
jgi:2'-hydroxyisoflavone reductase